MEGFLPPASPSLSVHCSGNAQFGIVGALAKRSWKQLSIYIDHVKIAELDLNCIDYVQPNVNYHILYL